MLHAAVTVRSFLLIQLLIPSSIQLLFKSTDMLMHVPLVLTISVTTVIAIGAGPLKKTGAHRMLPAAAMSRSFLLIPSLTPSLIQSIPLLLTLLNILMRMSVTAHMKMNAMVAIAAGASQLPKTGIHLMLHAAATLLLPSMMMLSLLTLLSQ